MTPPLHSNSCRYFVSAGSAIVVVHIFGAASYLNCRAFGRFMEIQSKGRAFQRRLCVNMSGCTALDSTVAGLLAKCAYDAAEGHEWGKVGIIRASARIREVLLNLGLGQVLEFMDDLPAGTVPNMEEISRYVQQSGACEPQDIFLAHEALIALDETNVEKFADVINSLRDDLETNPAKIDLSQTIIAEADTTKNRIKFDTRNPSGPGTN